MLLVMLREFRLSIAISIILATTGIILGGCSSEPRLLLSTKVLNSDAVIEVWEEGIGLDEFLTWLIYKNEDDSIKKWIDGEGYIKFKKVTIYSSADGNIIRIDDGDTPVALFYIDSKNLEKYYSTNSNLAKGKANWTLLSSKVIR